MVAVPQYLQPKQHCQPKVEVADTFVLAVGLEALEAQASDLAETLYREQQAHIGHSENKVYSQRKQQLESAQMVVWDAIRKEKARQRRYRASLAYKLAHGLPIDEASA